MKLNKSLLDLLSDTSNNFCAKLLGASAENAKLLDSLEILDELKQIFSKESPFEIYVHNIEILFSFFLDPYSRQVKS